MIKIEELIQELDLLPHPEGGFYKETYRADRKISLLEDNSDLRNLATSIYFLLTIENFSAFHRIRQDELWYYHGGAGMIVHEINKKGEHIEHRLHLDPDKGSPQCRISGGSWFASEVMPGQDVSWSLSGCMVAPGFDFADFEMAKKKELAGIYPKHSLLINRLCR